MNQFRRMVWMSVLLLPGLSTLASADTAPAAAPAASSAPIATIGSVVLTDQQMQAEIAPQLYDAEHQIYQIKKNWIDQKAKQILFTQAAAASGMSLQDWETKQIDSQVTPPTQAEIGKAVHQYFPNQLAPSTTTVQQVTTYLSSQKRTEREQVVYQDLATKTPVTINLTKPATPHVNVSYAADDPAKGPKDAPVTILEFTDYQCPYCKQSQVTLEKVEAAYKGKVKVVTREYPLPFHDRAKPAAEAALCALEQGKYWPYREKLFASPTLTDGEFKQFAKDVGLNQKKFDACVAENRYANRIDKDIADGQHFGVNGTPHFFVNGESISGAQQFPVFKDAIDDALAEAKIPTKKP